MVQPPYLRPSFFPLALKQLKRGDVGVMKYGTDRFFVQLIVELPQKQ